MSNVTALPNNARAELAGQLTAALDALSVDDHRALLTSLEQFMPSKEDMTRLQIIGQYKMLLGVISNEYPVKDAGMAASVARALAQLAPEDLLSKLSKGVSDMTPEERAEAKRILEEDARKRLAATA